MLSKRVAKLMAQNGKPFWQRALAGIHVSGKSALHLVYSNEEV